MQAHDEALLTLVGGPDVITHITKPRTLDRVPTEFVAVAENRAALERLGFTIGEVEDDLFTAVTAPEGWGLVATDHYMYSTVVDGQGRARGQLGYKGVFYDRWCSFYLLPRYAVEEVKPDNWFQMHYPTRLTRTVKRKVRVEPKSGWPARSVDHDGWDYIDSYGDPRMDRMFRVYGERPVQYETRSFEEELPEDQQPQPQAFDKGYGVLDRATGAFVFQTATYACQPKAYREQEEAERPLIAEATAWADARFPERRDVTAYW